MSRDKIARVAGVAQSDKLQSAQQLKLSQQDYERSCQQLQQLEQFKAEYEARLESAGEQGIAARQLQDYRRFLAKLNQAIEQQQQETASARENLDGAREHWLSKSRRSSVLDQVVDQQRQQHRRELDRAEQRESDEKAMSRAGQPPRS